MIQLAFCRLRIKTAQRNSGSAEYITHGGTAKNHYESPQKKMTKATGNKAVNVVPSFTKRRHRVQVLSKHKQNLGTWRRIHIQSKNSHFFLMTQEGIFPPINKEPYKLWTQKKKEKKTETCFRTRPKTNTENCFWKRQKSSIVSGEQYARHDNNRITIKIHPLTCNKLGTPSFITDFALFEIPKHVCVVTCFVLYRNHRNKHATLPSPIVSEKKKRYLDTIHRRWSRNDLPISQRNDQLSGHTNGQTKDLSWKTAVIGRAQTMISTYKTGLIWSNNTHGRPRETASQQSLTDDRTQCTCNCRSAVLRCRITCFKSSIPIV
jgi:hypothetical protein